jgi:hypothetical protein
LVDKPDSWAAWLTSVAAILRAIAWPTVVVWFLFAHRVRVATLLSVLAQRMSTANEIKAGPFELKNGEEIVKDAVNNARSQVSHLPPSKEDPAKQRKEADKQLKEAVKDAINLEGRLEATQLSESGAKYAVRRVLFGLAEEYDRLRLTMHSGPERTRKMNEIAAGMRTLAFEGLPLRTELTRSESVGKRLAAICMLQIEPRPRYFRWLIERVKTEKQAFVLFQASIAILEHVKKGFYINSEEARSEIKDAIRVVSAFPGGKPDQNTLDILDEALSLVR